MQNIAAVVLSGIFSVVLPFSILCMRDTVKRQRQLYIRELETVLHGPPDCERNARIIPSIEFVKFKYFLNHPSGFARDIPIYAWFVSCLPLFLVTLIFSLMTIDFILIEVVKYGPVIISSELIHKMPQDASGSRQDIPSWVWIMIAAFVGGYICMLRNLVRAVHNFDLHPISFVSASVQLIIGIATAMILFATAQHAMITHKNGDLKLLAPALVIAAFAVGFLPDLGLRTIIRRSRLAGFKREDEEMYRSFSATPVEVIDGIDTEIRSRLSDYHIVAVQNLATANPIMLFVETPFGIYQIMDWVAQAQLCCSVGPKCMLQLWKLGVRTIFDLERIGTRSSSASTVELRQAVGHAIFITVPKSQINLTKKGNGESGKLNEERPTIFDDDSVIADIQLRLDDPHVHRLRQIYLRVKDRLGADNARLDADRLFPVSTIPSDEHRPRSPMECPSRRAALEEVKA